MFDLRLINIIENCERKQKTRTCKRKRKRQIKFDLEQKRIKNCCRKRQTTSNINKKYSFYKFKVYIRLFNANNNLFVALLSNSIKILFNKFIIINFVN